MGLLCAIWLGTLGWRHLIPSDEGRYAEIAREMLTSGNWIVPRYNGYLYFEKPPLQMWGTSLIFYLFGLGEWQARLWSGITSLLGIFMVGYTSLKTWGLKAGTISAIVLASSPMWILGGHFNSLDMGIAFFMCCALCSLLLAMESPIASPEEKKWMLICWGSMALSVLSKGLIGIVLPGLVLITYSLTAREWGSWKRMHWLLGLSLFFLITAPWFIAISLQHESFLRFFFIHEHFERFTTNEHQRTAPWHFFIELILVGFLPWLWEIPQSISEAIRDRKDPLSTFHPKWLCLVWVIVITAFFSYSQSKLPGYIIPVFPALAIMAGASLQTIFKKAEIAESFSKLWSVQLLFFTLFFASGFFFLSKIAKTGEVYEAQMYANYAQIIGVAISMGCIGCFTAWIYRNFPVKSISIFAATLILVTLTAGLGHEVVGRNLSGVDLALKVKPHVRPNQTIYSVEMLDHTLPFYLEHSMVMVNFEDELAFGISQEPDKWIKDEATWVTLWKSEKSNGDLALMSHHKYQHYLSEQLPMQILGQDHLNVIVQKPISKNLP